MIRNILAETLDRVSRNLALRPNYTMEEYQRWFDQNPEYMHNGAMQHIQLVEPLTLEGTNNLYRAQFWLEHPNDPSRYVEQEIVVKICKFWASPGKNRLHRLNMLLSAFQDEIRINNLIHATNIEGVVQSMGGGIAGRHPYLKMEFIKGCSLDRLFRAKLRESVTEYGGQITPCYSAPEQAIMGENLSASVDYFSFGIIVHEYLTGEPLFPHSMDIFIEDGYRITDRYLEYLKTGRENRFSDPRFPELTQWIDNLTIFDSFERMQNSPNLFDIAHKLRERVNAQGYRDVNTDFLWNQLREYNRF